MSSHWPVILPGVLAIPDCDLVMERLLAARPDWRERRPGFFTLGANAYQDAAGSLYAEATRRSNALLAKAFGWVYHRLTRSLAEMTGLDTVLSGRLCWPGFHIFDVSGLSAAGGQVHVDLQYLRLAGMLPDLARAELVLSLTVPIMLPEGGGGLNVWPVRAGSTAALRANRAEPGQRWPDLPHEFIPYRAGSLYVHSGHFYHQIAGTGGTAARARPAYGQWRVTLQGHGYVVDDRLYLYW
jgi:hypothetical protein